MPSFDQARAFWKERADDQTRTAFPAFTAARKPGERQIAILQSTSKLPSDYGFALVKAVWALVVCRYSDARDAIFGTIEIGQNEGLGAHRTFETAPAVMNMPVQYRTERYSSGPFWALN